MSTPAEHLAAPLSDSLAALCGRAACRGFVATQQDKRDLIWLRNNLSRLMGDEDLSFYAELSRVSSILFDEFGETSHQTCSGHLREGIATLHARIATLEAELAEVRAWWKDEEGALTFASQDRLNTILGLKRSACLSPDDCEWTSKGWCPRCEPIAAPTAPS